MLAERSAAELTTPERGHTTDRSMLVLQYVIAGVSLAAAILLAGVH